MYRTYVKRWSFVLIFMQFPVAELRYTGNLVRYPIKLQTSKYI